MHHLEFLCWEASFLEAVVDGVSPHRAWQQGLPGCSLARGAGVMVLLLTGVGTQFCLLSSSLHKDRAWISRLEVDEVVQ